jgi:hypothetical protein
MCEKCPPQLELATIPNFATGRVPEQIPQTDLDNDGLTEQASEEQPKTKAGIGRLRNLATGAGLLAMNEVQKTAPYADMVAVCGCGYCGTCRIAFAGGVITTTGTKVKGLFSRNQEA